MRDINDLNNEYLTEKTYKLKKVFKTGSTTYLGKIRIEEWMVKKIVESGSETLFSEAGRFNNPTYTDLDSAWTDKLSLVYT